jgi:hypothetical protein
MYSQYSSYDESYKEPTIISNPTYSTTRSAPIIVTVDNYGLQDNGLDTDEARLPKHVFKFSGANDTATGENPAELDIGAIRDVVSIELIYANVAIADGGELYTILRVNDYSRVRSSNPFAKNSYCLIHNQNPGADEFYSVRRLGIPDDTMIHYFPEPTKLNKLDIEFISPMGDPFVFKGPNPNIVDPAVDPAEVTVHYVLTFEIRTLNRGPPKPDARFTNPVKGPW